MLSVTVLMILFTCGLVAADEFEPQFHPELNVSRAAGEIRIDGELDDRGWEGVAVARGFAEISPGDQVAPDVESEAWIAYDETNLYLAFLARDDPSEVRVSFRDRDQIFADDYFGLMLDTYGDASWGYEFFVNPYGIQGDLRMLASGDEDIAFDQIWESRGKVTDRGYQVEIAIPFASLRFPTKTEQRWRVNFWRDRQREVRYRYAWAAIDRDDPCFMCQWGTITGVSNIRPGKNLEVIASAVGSRAGALDDYDDPSSAVSYDDPNAEGSLNFKYGITSNASAELTINPDFSQIESDAGQIDVNETFALFFPERRPFFQEGSDLYSTWIDAVYTRTINNPDVAAKFTGQFGSTRMAYTFAHDTQSFMTVPFAEKSYSLELDESVSNIFRAKHTIKNDSYLGVIGTDRRLSGDGSNSTAGVDGLFRFFKNYQVEFQFVAGHTEEPDDSTLSASFDTLSLGEDHTARFDGESYWGRGIYFSPERHGRHWSLDFDYWEYSPEFRAGNGFVNETDYRLVNGRNEFQFQPDRQWVSGWGQDMQIGRKWDHDGSFREEWARPSLWIDTRAQTNVRLNAVAANEQFAGFRFDSIRRYWININSRFSDRLTLSGGTLRGRTIHRDFDDPQLGNVKDYWCSATYEPHERVSIAPVFSFSRMESRREGNETLFDGYILRTRVNLSFTRQWFARLVGEYDSFNDEFDLEPLLTYKVNPFTVFYIGFTNRFENLEPDIDSDGEAARIASAGGSRQESEWRLSERQYFAKISYLHRF